jgi:hypothetical protein
LSAQTTTTGELAGTIKDASGAVLPNASVTLKSTDTNSVLSSQSNAAGAYRFSLLQPGIYLVTATAAGFKGSERRVQIGLGGSVAVDLQLAVGTASVTIEVGAADATVATEDANLNTNYDARQLEDLPNPGNDLSAVAFTAPGAVVNTAGGAANGGGNFEMYGLPATSNVFTVDGANYNDPYFNVNNSGATNLTLGLNELQESAVVANGYSGAYGGAAGANINFVTKSGTNKFHGNAVYWWNGSSLNANNYFLNQQGQPRPFVNANQFAGSVGGPIVKDKSFFFFDYEGVYLAVPVPNSVNVPTAAFESAVIGNLNATGMSASVPFYNTLFGLYNGVSHAGATAVSGGGCDDATLVNGIVFGPSNPCALTLQLSPITKTHDVFYSGRYDQNLSSADRLFLRVEHEHGLQASYTDPISPNFNAISDQPQWQSNLQETHTFGSDKVNTLNASLLWYSAIFQMAKASGAVSALTTLPGQTENLGFNDGTLSSLNPNGNAFPQGRNITQYQLVDDFSWTHGRHNLKSGMNFRRDDISDHNFTSVTPAVIEFSLGDFVTGGGQGAGNEIIQSFPLKTVQPIALYQLGFYGADDVRITNNFKLTLSMRLDHFSNPVCQTNCFQRLAGVFGQLNTSSPVNQAILVGQHNAFPSVTPIAVQPKIGFAWSPFGESNTVLRGGIGVFADSLPTGAIDNFMAQAPNDPRFHTFSGALSPAESGNLYAASQASNAAFRANYESGGPVPRFSFTNSTAVKVPRYYEWSLELQRALGRNSILSIGYVGNRGTHEEISNLALNAFSTTPFADLPSSAPDPRFGRVGEVQNTANSNYNGFSANLKHTSRGGLTVQAAYTWSHGLDEISNTSLAPFGQNTIGQYADIIYPQDPLSLRKYNYGNADYDIRHNFTMNYLWNDAFRHLTGWGPNVLMKGWTFSGTLFRHSGLPFTVVSSSVTGTLQGSNYGNGVQQVFADVVGPITGSCDASAAHAASPCLLASSFSDPVNNWGQQRRNQFRGPGYFNTDFAVDKAFGIPKWEQMQFWVGARFFNVLNHPNFSFPVMNLDNPQLGQILQTVSSPTSIYGSGLGADASPRLIQLQAKITF